VDKFFLLENKSWRESEGEKPLNQTNFGRRLTERGYEKKKPHVTYRGVRLLNPPALKSRGPFSAQGDI
jgi:hypothetical protein